MINDDELRKVRKVRKVHYSVRCPFPDEDMWCFLLDKSNKVHYYDSKADATAEAAKYVNAIVVEHVYYGS